MKNVLQPLTKSVLIPSGLTAAASATHKRILGSRTTTLRIENEEMEDIMKIVKSLKYSGLLVKRVTQTVKNETKNKRVDFLVHY